MSTIVHKLEVVLGPHAFRRIQERMRKAPGYGEVLKQLNESFVDSGILVPERGSDDWRLYLPGMGATFILAELDGGSHRYFTKTFYNTRSPREVPGTRTRIEVTWEPIDDRDLITQIEAEKEPIPA